MPVRTLATTFARGGTSNGLILHRAALPARVADWQPILAAAMGSPDTYGRQLDGMGSGVSSTSKVCVVERSGRTDADVDFTFVQVGIRDGALDTAGNCGNMSSVIGPWAVEEGLVEVGAERMVNGEGERVARVRIFNTNTSKIVEAEFRLTEDGRYDPSGGYSIDGVPGTASKITLSFVDPGGAKTGKVLPTGNPIDVLELEDGSTIRASLVDVANPGVFVLADDLQLPGDIAPATLEKDDAMMARLEQIRRKGTALMGLDPATQAVPKIVIISRPDASRQPPNVNIVCRALSMQQPHKAVPLTLALNLGAACRLPGTLPAATATGIRGDSVTLAHASGTVEVGCTFEDGRIKSALLHRTARLMMKGEVYYTTNAT